MEAWNAKGEGDEEGKMGVWDEGQRLGVWKKGGKGGASGGRGV